MSRAAGAPRASLAGRVVVVTGASGGIGAALAREVAVRGGRPVLAARRPDALKAAAAGCGPGAVAVVADLTVRADAERLAAEAVAACGHIDAWVHNVGRGITRAPSALTDDDVDTMMRVNVKAALYGTQAVLPHFRARGAGHLVTVSSLLGRHAYIPLRSAYCGAKHFLNAWVQTLRTELAQSDPAIAVSLVSPGVVHTDFGLNAVHGGPDSRGLPDGQAPEEVARVIADVLETRRPDVYTRAGMRDRILAHQQRTGEDP